MGSVLLYLAVTAIVIGLAFLVNSDYRRQLNNFYVSREDRAKAVNRQELINIACVSGIFIVLFVLSSLRSGIGNDYWVYRYKFLDIARGDTPTSYEMGFIALVKLMQAIVGMDNYVPIFAVVAFLTMLFTLKGLYDTSDWFGMTVVLYMFNGFYFMSFSNIRYYLALGMVLYAMKYLFARRFVPFCFVIICASLFHMTALLVIPAYFVALYLKWGRKTWWLIPAACAGLFFGKYLIRKLVFVFYPFYEGDLMLDVQRFSWGNIAKCAAILIFALIFYRRIIKGNEKAEFFFNLNLFALVLYTFASYVPEITRVCYYFVIGQIFLVPIVLMKIENVKLRRLCTAGISVAYFTYFLIFLKQGLNPVIQILPYFSWYFA